MRDYLVENHDFYYDFSNQGDNSIANTNIPDSSRESKDSKIRSMPFSSKNFIRKKGFYDSKEEKNSKSEFINSAISNYYGYNSSVVTYYLGQLPSQERTNFSEKFSKQNFENSNNDNSAQVSDKNSKESSKNSERELIVDDIKSVSGCSFFQRRIRQNPQYGNIFLYNILKPEMLNLIRHYYGNYLYQDFIDILNKENFIHFLKFLKSHFQELSFSEHSSKVIQKLAEYMNLINEKGQAIYKVFSVQIKGKVQEMSKNEHATYIIQKLIVNWPFPYNSFIYEEIIANLVSISTSRFGRFVIKKCLENGEEINKKSIINLLLKNILSLISDQFGNYVFQYIINFDEKSIVPQIFNSISNQVILLCKGKYSSNVMEKLFEIQDKKLINKIAKKVLHKDSIIIELLSNQYGNFIIQKIIKNITSKKLLRKILMVIVNNSEKLQKKSRTKKILDKINVGYYF